MKRFPLWFVALGLLLVAVLSGCATVPTDSDSMAADTAQATATQVLSLGGSAHVSYPATWLTSPGYPALEGGTLISSVPLGPCPTDRCQNYTVPPNGVAIEFHYNPLPPGAPTQDWDAVANDTVAGRPAVREDWGPVNAHDANEGHTWIVQMPNGAMVIAASLMGPDLSIGHGFLQQILASLVVGP
jgi:hypothetical protein